MSTVSNLSAAIVAEPDTALELVAHEVRLASLEDQVQWPGNVLRRGAEIATFFACAYFLIGKFQYPATAVETAPWYFVAIMFGVAGFLLNLRRRAPLQWRIETLALVTGTLWVGTHVAIVNHIPLACEITAIIAMLVTGSLLPWELGWQLALTASCAFSIALCTPVIPPAEAMLLWSGFTVAAITGASTSKFWMNWRVEMLRQYEAFRKSNALMHEEAQRRIKLAAECEQITRTAENKERTLRQILDSLTDLVVLTRESDGAFIETNAAFKH